MATPIGLTRRLQALHALGWSTNEVARITGLTAATVRRLARAEGSMSPPTEMKILHGYARASARVPHPRDDEHRAELARRRLKAYEQGWAPPYAWDDIDDESATPKGVRRPGNSVPIVGIDEAVLLLQLGVAPLEVARRLGVKPFSLARRLRRAQLHKWASMVERASS